MSSAPSGADAVHRSPFDGHVHGERPNRAGQIGVHLSAGTLCSVTLIGTWPDGTEALCAALGASLGVVVPATTGDTVQVAVGLLMRIGPQEFMLVSEHALDQAPLLRQKIAADIGSVTDLSHARCRIRIEGERCRDTLSKLFALDLRQVAFAVEQVRLTGHHHVPCTLHRRALDSFDMLVFSGYAHDQLSTLIDAALEYGVSLTPSHAVHPANGVVDRVIVGAGSAGWKSSRLSGNPAPAGDAPPGRPPFP